MLDDFVSLKDIKFFPRVKRYPINYSFIFSALLCEVNEDAVNTLLRKTGQVFLGDKKKQVGTSPSL